MMENPSTNMFAKIGIMSKKYNPQDLIDWLLGQMKQKGWGVRETAKRAGISHPLISDALKGIQPSEKTCILLAVTFGESVEQVLIFGGHLTKREVDGNPLKKTLIKQVDTLDDAEVEEAIWYVRSIKQRPAQFKKGTISN